MAKRYTGIQIDFAHLAANSPPNLYLPVAPGEHWDTTDSKFKIQEQRTLYSALLVPMGDPDWGSIVLGASCRDTGMGFGIQVLSLKL
jgi:hypothetical protein